MPTFIESLTNNQSLRMYRYSMKLKTVSFDWHRCLYNVHVNINYPNKLRKALLHPTYPPSLVLVLDQDPEWSDKQSSGSGT